jgi:hypothetical protein
MKRHWLLIAGLVVALIVSVGTDTRAQTTREVELAWDASPSAGVTYNAYRSEVAGGCAAVPPHASCAKLNSTPILVLSFTDAAVPVGRSYFYTATAERFSIESGPSNEVNVDLTVPAPPSNLRLVAVLLAGLGLLLLLLFWRRR